MKEEKGTETKLCKHCKTEIPKKAKVCPNCRKKQSGIGKWILIVVIAFILFEAVSTGEQKPKKAEPETIASTEKSGKKKKKAKDHAKSEESEKETEEQTEEQTEEKSTFGIGETAELNDIQVTMKSYSESQGSEYNKPTEGKEFVLVEFEIANNSDKELNVSSVMSFEGYADDYALSYSVAALMEKNEANQLDGTIAPGKKMNGVIGYEVPTDWKNLEIHFTDNVWSSSKFKFEISR